MELSLIATVIPEIDSVALQDELISFASSYKDLKNGLLENMNDNENDSDRLESKEYTDVAESSEKTTCKNCFSCAFKLLSEYRLCAAAYKNSCAAYKFIVTRSITQNTCERCFSKLKLLKRSSLPRITWIHTNCY